MKGFSIVELMVVVMVTAIILGLGAPSFADFQRNNRLTTAANDLLGVIQTARSEAIKRQSAVSICPTSDPSAADPKCNDGPFLGYVAFDDVDSDCSHDPGEQILRVGEKLESPPGNPLNVVSDGNCISFAATGFQQKFADAVSTTANHILFCDNRGMKENGSSNDGATLVYARGVNISVTGRARVTRDKSEIVKWAPKVVCP
jgi:type IV fimbrial biogenesis protein FimT